MQTIYHLLTILLLWLHMAALASLGGKPCGSWAIGRAGLLMLLLMILFLVEHIVGLGRLHWLLPFSTVASGLILWVRKPFAKENRSNGFLSAELVFGLALFFGVFWKECFPSIYITSERLPDLVFITNFLPGEQLPPVDHWNPPYPFDYYYSLQYYAAALAGRVLHMSPGLTYNLCFALIQALSISLIWDVAARFLAHRTSRALLAAALICGGTGASLLNHLIHENPPNLAELGHDAQWRAYDELMMGSGHFTGGFVKQVNTPLGLAMFPAPKPDEFVPLVGMENFGLQFYQSDFHAPLGGYCLLLLALALIFALEREDRPEPQTGTSQRRQFLLALTMPAVFAVNTWVVPLHAALLGAWALRRLWLGRKDAALRPDWLALIGGGVFGFLCLYFFLIGFTAGREPTPMRLVFPGQHTPWRDFIALFWPLLALIGMALVRPRPAQSDWHGLALFFGIVFAALLLFSEFVFVDDSWSGVLERYNTTMKWWGWVWTGGLVALGALLLASEQRWMRYVAGASLALTLVSAVDMVNVVRFCSEHNWGLLEGDNVYTGEPAARDMFRYLAGAPDGIVLENQYEGGYHDGCAYAAFSGKPLLLGWVGHLDRWRGHSDAREMLKHQINDFYNGALPDAGAWLAGKKVQYIVWNQRDTLAAPAWDRLNAELSQHYAWEAFGNAGGRPVGIWVKRDGS